MGPLPRVLTPAVTQQAARVVPWPAASGVLGTLLGMAALERTGQQGTSLDDSDADVEAVDRPAAPRLDVGELAVEGVIIHEVPERPSKALVRAGEAEDTEPFVTDIECELGADFQHYLEGRIATSLSEAGFPVTMREETESVVPALVLEILEHPPDQGSPPPTFIDASQTMAERLHAAQGANSPTGLLAVVRGTWRKHPFVAALKLEKEEGLRIEPEEVGEQRTFRVVVERELVMTQNTKVFKTGIFRKTGQEDEVEGWVSDAQTFGGAGKVAADFFVERFLGCRLVDQPEILTKKFFDEAEKWINRAVPDPVEKTDYERALITEMVNNKTQVVPQDFVQENFHGPHRAALLDALDDRGAPTFAFDKDTKLIARRLHEVKMRFRGGISVSIARENFDSGIATLAKDPDDEQISILTVRDVLDRLGSS
jgi:hypothetical protein